MRCFRAPLPDGPASTARWPTVEALLPYVASMGFDVLYLPPIHPIGEVERKGPNNRAGAGPDDPGSPWAIGSREGGHKAVHPRLGTLADFRRLLAGADALGIEIALDIAFQCAPDHPYVREHPEWFLKRPGRLGPVCGESAEEVPGHLSRSSSSATTGGGSGRS